MFKLSEYFPFESLGPLLGGVIVWFGLNYLVIAPKIIAPRLAEKYYVPSCTNAVTEGRRTHTAQVETARRQLEARLNNLAGELQQAMRSQAAQGLGMLFGGRPGSEQFMRQHGETLNQWAGQLGNIGAPAIQQRLNQERAEFETEMRNQEAEARRGVIHATPERFCRCVVSEGMRDNFEVAAFTASLRLYTPPTVRRLEEGTIPNNGQVCGAAPIV